MDASITKNEKEGLIPVTIKMLKNASKKEEKLEYLGIVISEITLTGFVVKYSELDTRTAIGIWDQTGYQEVIFYNKSENESHSGLSGFLYTGEKTPVRIFGKAKFFKNELRIDGAKIMKIDMNEFIYHKIVLINDWMYLTLREKDDIKHYNVNPGSTGHIATSSSSGGINLKDKILDAINVINNTKGTCNKSDIQAKTGVKMNELEDKLRVLISESNIYVDEDGHFQII